MNNYWVNFVLASAVNVNLVPGVVPWLCVHVFVAYEFCTRLGGPNMNRVAGIWCPWPPFVEAP